MLIFHTLFGLLLACSGKISCKIPYLHPCLILKRMKNHFEKKIISDGAYLHVLFGLLIAWSSTIRPILIFICFYTHILVAYIQVYNNDFRCDVFIYAKPCAGK